ncbi:MAG: hypothetical protein J6B12_02765, partial [Clostridia bacterium]|nr:hypothetical protein [Clostridia bacterium]
QIAAQILTDIPLAKLAKERIKPKRRLGVWEIVLIAIGSPIWLSLAIAVLAVVFSLYAVLWSVVISFWAVFVSLACCAFGGVVAGGAFAFGGYALSGVAVVAAGLICAGLSIFAFFGCKAATKGAAMLAKGFALGLKKCFVGKERAE